MTSAPRFNRESLPTEVHECHSIIRLIYAALSEQQAQYESLRQQILDQRPRKCLDFKIRSLYATAALS